MSLKHEAVLKQFCSIGEIASHLAVPIHRVEYAVRKLNVQSAAKIGGRHLYGADDAEAIGRMIRGLDTKRAVKIATQSVRSRGFKIEPADQMLEGCQS